MFTKLLSVSGAASLLVIVTTACILGRLLRANQTLHMAKDDSMGPVQKTAVGKELSSALPGSVLFPDDGIAFKQVAENHWAQQASQTRPSCIIRPRNSEELSVAVKILSRVAREKPSECLFAVRSGGHSWVSDASSIGGGVLIDLSLLCEVKVSEDRTNVVIGTGARWKNVSTILDTEGLAVIGGRDSDVGVGGFMLGGGISFFSPRFGLACSSVVSYEVVLASGLVVTASESSRPDLWRALKGGGNNLGIVTRFTVPCFAQGKIWGGYNFLPSFQRTKVISAFHNTLQRSNPVREDTIHDENAAGPLICFSWLGSTRFELILIHLAYTKISENEKGWPSYWRKSPFASLWRYWSSAKKRTLTNATEELQSYSNAGKRQQQTTLTIKNDLATLNAAHATYKEAAATFARAGVRDITWTLVIQPLAPDWLRKGHPNPMGLHECGQDPLVLVLYVAVWTNTKDDEHVMKIALQSAEKLEAIAKSNGTFHRYKYLNYCGDGQKPFQGYGEEGLRFLKQVSQKYDPEGLFQRQCLGGFKLGLSGETLQDAVEEATVIHPN